MNNQSVKASVLEHIEDLRKKLLWCILSLLVTTMGSFAGASYIIRFLSEPIGGPTALQSIEVTENVSVFMKVSLLSGFILALPFILFQLISFLSPGLEPKEKRLLITFIPLAFLLFIGGATFAYYVMMPAAIPFLVNFGETETVPRLSNYIGFITNLLFWIGMSFEAPLVIFLLAKLHLITAKDLIKQWRIAIVVMAVLAAAATPTVDPINMGLLMLPLLVLYIFSIILALIANPKKEV